MSEETARKVDTEIRKFVDQGYDRAKKVLTDKIDDLHFYTLFIKFGIGRAPYDVSQEIRNDH